MSITFRHKIKKQAIFYNDLVSGRTAPGPNGSAGKYGTNGPSIYFCDEEINDDYSKKTILDKISQGMFLTSGSTTNLVGISYTPGDLIITSQKHVYKLVSVNGKNDLKYLGQFTQKNKTAEEEEKLNLTDLIKGVKICNIERRGQLLPVPTNRGMESSKEIATHTVKLSMDTYGWVEHPQWIDVSYGYKECLKKSFGFDFFPIVKINGTEDISASYDFYLKIRVKNQKYIQAGAYTLNEYVKRDSSGDEPAPSNMDPFTFYKSSEIKLKAYTGSSEPTYTDSSYSDNGFKRCCITEMTCDKLHPSGNGINSNIVDCEYESGYTLNDSSVYVGAIDNLEGYNNNENQPCSNKSDSSIDSSNVYLTDRNTFLVESYKKTAGFLQYPRRELNSNNYYAPNYRGGDTAFFSGLTTSNYQQGNSSEGKEYYFDSSVERFYLNLGPGTTNVMDGISAYYEFANHVNYMTHSLQGDASDGSIYQDRRFNWELDYVVNDCLLPFYFYPNWTKNASGTKDIVDKRNIYELVCVNRNTGETYTFPLNPDYKTISKSGSSLSFSIG